MNSHRLLRFGILLFLLVIVCVLFIPSNSAVEEVAIRDYTVRPDGSILYNSGQIAYGIPTFIATDDIKYLKSDYPGASLIDYGSYWSTPEPSPLSGRFYDVGRIYLGKDTNHYVGVQPVGIFYVNYQNPAEREQLISLTSMSLSVNDNVATYSQGPVSIIFTNSFSQIKGDVIFPNSPPVPTVSNPALAVVWEVVGHAGISMEDGERETWWFEQAKAAFPVGDIQNNGSAVLKKKIFRQNGKIYLVEGVGYGWVSDANRTDSQFIIDPTLEYNGSDSWAGTSGPMIEHGDTNLRNPPNVTTGLVSYWNPSTDVGSGNTLTDVWGSNDGTITGAVWNVSGGGLDYDGDNDCVNCGNDESLNLTANRTIIVTMKVNESGHGSANPRVIRKGSNYYWYKSVANMNMVIYDGSASGYVSVPWDGTSMKQKVQLVDRTNQKMYGYVDGVLINTDNDISDVGNTGDSSNMYLGCSSPGMNEVNGTIGSTYIYNVFLTNIQINETRDNYHTNSSYRQIDTANDYGAGQVLKHINVTGTDPSVNTSMAVYVNGSHDNITFNGWELINGSCNVGDNVTVPIAYEYRYLGSPGVKVVSNTTYQPETNVIESIILTSDSPSAPIITLLSQTPSTICQKCTGNISIEYGISHSSTGLNNTSISFIYRDYDHDLSDSNHSIRPPINNLASEWNYDGRILRGANRNESLNFENNATITGGDTYSWSGLDENNSEMFIVPINSSYTKVYINSTIHRVMPQMHYIDRSELQEAPKTTIAIHKNQDVLVKFWNFEIYKGNTDFLGVGYTDTTLNTNSALHPSDANPVNYYYISSGYDPATGGDPLTSGYAVYMGSLNATGWVDHVYSPYANSSYVRGFINNTLLHSYINTTNISYVLYTSNTPSNKGYLINVTDVATSSNVSFANTSVLWAGDNAMSAEPYTPSVWFAFMKLNMSLDHKLYAADNNDLWGSSSMNRTNITQALFPPTTPTINHFHFLGETDYDMDGVYYGNFSIGCGVSSDPDGGDVTHNLTLHYADNLTLVTIINNTFTDKDITHNGVYFDANFSSIPYYSQTDNYTLRLIGTDDESETVTVWLGVNFSLDGSPRIITYSPETPVYSSEGENQTFSITTNLPGNMTWYLDSVEVFNETGVNSSSYSNSTASFGTYNVTVVTTNTNGSNSMTWEWNVILPEKIPLSIFIMWSVVMFIGAIIGFMTTGLYGITSSLLTATIAYMNSKNIINGNVVQYFSGVSTSDTIVVGYRSIESLPMSYIYLFIAIVMVIVFILQVKNEIQYNLEPDIDGEFFDE